MNLADTILFSLIWGGILWLPLAIARQWSTKVSPPMLFALILVIVLPSLLAGLQLDMVTMVPQYAAADLATRFSPDVREITLAINGLKPAWRFDWQYWSLFLIGMTYSAGLAVHLYRVVRASRDIHQCAASAKPLPGHTSDGSVRVTQQLRAPFAVGIPNPVIIIPQALLVKLTIDQIAMVIAHEEAHLRRGDPVRAFILALVVAFFWFNPFVRNLVSRWYQSCELHVDAIVLRGASPPQRRTYARALLDALSCTVTPTATPVTMAFTQSNLRIQKLRLSKIIKGSEITMRTPLARWLTVLGIGAAAMVGSFTALSGATAGQEPLLYVENGRLYVSYGIIRSDKTVHKGIDIVAPKGSKIVAPQDATVLEATDLFRGEWRYGKTVALQMDDDLIVWFAHLDQYTVKRGDKLKRGEVFATVGNTGKSTGPHLHVETFRDRGRKRVDPSKALGVY